MPREMLKLRKGDSAIMIKADGSVEMAGVNDKPLMDNKGMMSPVILFAAAWAKKDRNLFDHMIDNFKNCVREGYFGPEAQEDFKQMESKAASGAVTTDQKSQGIEVIPTVTDEEWDKMEKEQENLRALASNIDPRVQRQQEALKAGGKVTSSEPMTLHKEPDLPVEKTMKYQKATPEEQEKMKKEQAEKLNPVDLLNASGVKTPEEAAKVLNSINEEQTVGNVTIEENKDNEDQ